MVFEIKREPIGIPNIDNMVNGGLPKGSVTGISGPPGVGKSIFSLHFILEGARKGQKSVYINLEEPRRNIDNMIHQFNFKKEFEEFERRGLIIIKCFDYNKYEKIHEDLLDKIHDDKNIRRLVIDSFNCFFASNYEFESKVDMAIKRMIVEAFYKLRHTKLTTLLTLEDGKESNFNIPYLVDGMINLDYLDLGTIERRISIPKMRWTDQNKEGKSYEISKDGIKICEDSWEG
ncbi:AAA family ATPase [Candidatus Pacearchaeota archaeon]|nr:AAA family ATPase [Candidatus Pacearchaeota archaeon]